MWNIMENSDREKEGRRERGQLNQERSKGGRRVRRRGRRRKRRWGVWEVGRRRGRNQAKNLDKFSKYLFI